MTLVISKEINCIGDNCPMPLIKTREAILNSKPGEVIRIIGDHPQSYDEIPLALKAQGKEIIERKKEGNIWIIVFEN